MWSEYVDAVNMVPRTWPRLSVVAERLWSDRSVNNTREAVLRLEEHRYLNLITLNDLDYEFL
jgi:N-acetyl-beta-hexosaminidase